MPKPHQLQAVEFRTQIIELVRAGRSPSDLSKEVRQLKLERDILGKATAWFAVKSEKSFVASKSS